jgi:hypothetical protein
MYQHRSKGMVRRGGLGQRTRLRVATALLVVPGMFVTPASVVADEAAGVGRAAGTDESRGEPAQTPEPAQKTSEPEPPGIEVTGFVDTYYLYNLNGRYEYLDDFTDGAYFTDADGDGKDSQHAVLVGRVVAFGGKT